MKISSQIAKKPVGRDIQLNPDGRPATMKLEEAAEYLGISRSLA